MKLREIHNIVHVSHLKPYTEEYLCREQQLEPVILFDDGHEELRK